MPIEPRYWNRQQKLLHEAQEAGVIGMTRQSSRLQVVCPYSDEFKAGALMLAGRWKAHTGMWSFPYATKPYIERLLLKVYGRVALDAALRDDV